MKLQINTNEKTVMFLENIPFKEMISILKKLFPNKEWEEYSLDTGTLSYIYTYPIWTPIYIDQPQTFPWTINCGDTASVSFDCYSVEINGN